MFYAIRTIRIPVRDVSRSLQWYVKVLDAIPWEYTSPYVAKFTLAGLQAIEFDLMRVHENHRLRFSSVDGRHVYTIFTFYTISAASVCNTLVARGVKVGPLESDEDGPYAFWFEDLDGNRFAVTSIPPIEWDYADELGLNITTHRSSAATATAEHRRTRGYIVRSMMGTAVRG